jgi:transcriptional regulator of acetoin/glycerol metabolism
VVDKAPVKTLADARKAAEREELRKALYVAKGNTGRAAELLGIKRKNIYALMRRHGIGGIRRYQRASEGQGAPAALD